ncbi:hypothetical protein ACHHV8_17825 [Paenibacillus sp. TAB 01]|uniref:hypothetical protein n=1 Tax=Paenibacillus sp. TAB 01 TaxID=3368988 RepID=UPI0037536CF3
MADREPVIAEELEEKLMRFVARKLGGRPDPMLRQIQESQLPFRRRIESILEGVGLSWEAWIQNPLRERYDTLEDERRARHGS